MLFQTQMVTNLVFLALNVQIWISRPRPQILEKFKISLFHDASNTVNTVEELEVDTFEESLHEEIENDVQTRQHNIITSIVKELNCCNFVLFILYLYLAAK